MVAYNSLWSNRQGIFHLNPLSGRVENWRTHFVNGPFCILFFSLCKTTVYHYIKQYTILIPFYLIAKFSEITSTPNVLLIALGEAPPIWKV